MNTVEIKTIVVTIIVGIVIATFSLIIEYSWFVEPGGKEEPINSVNVIGSSTHIPIQIDSTKQDSFLGKPAAVVRDTADAPSDPPESKSERRQKALQLPVIIKTVGWLLILINCFLILYFTSIFLFAFYAFKSFDYLFIFIKHFCLSFLSILLFEMLLTFTSNAFTPSLYAFEKRVELFEKIAAFFSPLFY